MVVEIPVPVTDPDGDPVRLYIEAVEVMYTAPLVAKAGDEMVAPPIDVDCPRSGSCPIHVSSPAYFDYDGQVCERNDGTFGSSLVSLRLVAEDSFGARSEPYFPQVRGP